LLVLFRKTGSKQSLELLALELLALELQGELEAESLKAVLIFKLR
jgi:hypothetical protein